MDPNATLRLIEEALVDNDWDYVDELCFELYDWLGRGGFEPEWNDYLDAFAQYQAWEEEYLKELI